MSVSYKEMNTTVRARVNSHMRELAKQNAHSLGLDLSTVIRLVVNKLANTGELPTDLLVPNSVTLKTIKNTDNGIDIHKANTIDELKNDLGWD